MSCSEHNGVEIFGEHVNSYGAGNSCHQTKQLCAIFIVSHISAKKHAVLESGPKLVPSWSQSNNSSLAD